MVGYGLSRRLGPTFRLLTMPSVLHIAHTDNLGGAARAAYRLHTALRTAGIDSRMLVGWSRTADPTVYSLGGETIHRVRTYGDRLLTMVAGGRWSSAWSNNLFPRCRYVFPDGWTPEIVNLHWVWGGFAALTSLELWSVPYVWTMHDMAAFTGGCHYTGSCERFTASCGSCPQLGSTRDPDRSTRILTARIEFARRRRPVVAAPSRWMAEQAGRSRAYRDARVVTIPNGLRFGGFRPLDRAASRAIFGIGARTRLIAFGAMGANHDPRKGYDLLVAALEYLGRMISAGSAEIIVFGGAETGTHMIHGFTCHSVGVLSTEERLAAAYSAADVFVAPSREDNLPNTLIEALACGTPGVGFAIGGIPEIITHGETGWLAPAFQTEALAECLRAALERAGDLLMRAACRSRVEQCFSEDRQVRDYCELYASLLGN